MKSTITGALRPDVLTTGQSRRRSKITASLCAASVLSIGWAAPAIAQETEQSGRAYVENGDIIVTARKRQESILKVPVVVTAVSGEQLSNVQVTTVTDLPRLVPGLVIAGNILSIGPQVTIRGVGTSSFDPGVDQSVSLNIDGLSLGQGLAFGSAMFDVGQVEVLKGPQALFYGKSSPGGVISLRTADPTDEFEIIGSASYEFVAREKRGELIVSGPVTDTLKLRLAALYSKADGYFINDAVPVTATGATAPTDRRNPQPRNFVIRGTVLFEPMEGFTARLKVNHSYDRTQNAELKQLSNCLEPGQSMTFGSGIPGTGIPAAPNFLTPVDPIRFIGTDNCKYDRRAPQVYLDPAAFPGVPNNGVPYLQNVQNFGTLEINYDLQSDLRLTSTTAYYKLKSSSSVNPTLSVASAPLFGVTNRFRRREFTQELRLDSDFSGPLNFTAGAFYEDGQLKDRVRFIRNIRFGFLSPAIAGADVLNDDRQSIVDIRTTSLFGQLRYKIVPEFELAGGVRWSDEKRTLSIFDFQNNRDNTPLMAPGSTIQRSKTWSPEFTATWTPTDDLTLFGSYKQGYKSGSFSVAVPGVPGQDKSFDDEKVKGYEIGVKSRLIGRSLLANVAWYDYRYRGLQVGVIEGFVNNSPVINTRNSGGAHTYGVDFDLMYRPEGIEGLTVTGSINWNKARYNQLDTLGCYPNQTFAQGCNAGFVAFPDTAPAGQLSQANPTFPGQIGATPQAPVNGVQKFGRYGAQNLNGAQMIRAPEWSANFGFTYEMPVGPGWKLQLSNNNQLSSKYPSFLANGRPTRADTGLPDNFQEGYFKIDAALALKAEDDRWEVALIGKNLTDELIASNCSPSNTAGGGVLGGERAGYLQQQGTAGWAEALCFPDGGGRAVYVRLTFRPKVGG